MPCRPFIFVLALAAAAPTVAQAQFTTFIPRRTADSVKAAVVATQQKVSDSVAKAQITDLKTWVDSASGIVAPGTAADSLARTTLADTSTTFRSGSRAPATASSLPLLALIGGAALLFGALLLSDRSSAGPSA